MEPGSLSRELKMPELVKDDDFPGTRLELLPLGNTVATCYPDHQDKTGSAPEDVQAFEPGKKTFPDIGTGHHLPDGKSVECWNSAENWVPHGPW